MTIFNLDTYTLAAVDPGSKGGIAIMKVGTHANGDPKSEMMVIPTQPTRNHAYDEYLKDVDFLFIEDVHASPGMGDNNSFAYGVQCGIWLGYIHALKIPKVKYVYPQVWQHFLVKEGHMDDFPFIPDGSGKKVQGGARKRFLYQQAQKMFPVEKGDLPMINKQTCDAALILVYAQKLMEKAQEK